MDEIHYDPKGSARARKEAAGSFLEDPEVTEALRALRAAIALWEGPPAEPTANMRRSAERNPLKRWGGS